MIKLMREAAEHAKANVTYLHEMRRHIHHSKLVAYDRLTEHYEQLRDSLHMSQINFLEHMAEKETYE